MRTTATSRAAGTSVQTISTRRRRSSEDASPAAGLAWSRWSSVPICSAKNAPPVSQNSVACTGSSEEGDVGSGRLEREVAGRRAGALDLDLGGLRAKLLLPRLDGVLAR